MTLNGLEGRNSTVSYRKSKANEGCSMEVRNESIWNAKLASRRSYNDAPREKSHTTCIMVGFVPPAGREALGVARAYESKGQPVPRHHGKGMARCLMGPCYLM